MASISVFAESNKTCSGQELVLSVRQVWEHKTEPIAVQFKTGDDDLTVFVTRAQLEQLFGTINNYLAQPIQVECRKCDVMVTLQEGYEETYALCGTCAMSKAGL